MARIRVSPVLASFAYTYSKSGWTMTPMLVGIVQGVVVQMSMNSPVLPARGNLTYIESSVMFAYSCSCLARAVSQRGQTVRTFGPFTRWPASKARFIAHQTPST